jgi:hypothetical protein
MISVTANAISGLPSLFTDRAARCSWRSAGHFAVKRLIADVGRLRHEEFSEAGNWDIVRGLAALVHQRCVCHTIDYGSVDCATISTTAISC